MVVAHVPSVACCAKCAASGFNYVISTCDCDTSSGLAGGASISDYIGDNIEDIYDALDIIGIVDSAAASVEPPVQSADSTTDADTREDVSSHVPVAAVLGATVNLSYRGKGRPPDFLIRHYENACTSDITDELHYYVPHSDLSLSVLPVGAHVPVAAELGATLNQSYRGKSRPPDFLIRHYENACTSDDITDELHYYVPHSDLSRLVPSVGAHVPVAAVLGATLNQSYRGKSRPPDFLIRHYENACTNADFTDEQHYYMPHLDLSHLGPTVSTHVPVAAVLGATLHQSYLAIDATPCTAPLLDLPLLWKAVLDHIQPAVSDKCDREVTSSVLVNDADDGASAVPAPTISKYYYWKFLHHAAPDTTSWKATSRKATPYPKTVIVELAEVGDYGARDAKLVATLSQSNQDICEPTQPAVSDSCGRDEASLILVNDAGKGANVTAYAHELAGATPGAVIGPVRGGARISPSRDWAAPGAVIGPVRGGARCSSVHGSGDLASFGSPACGACSAIASGSCAAPGATPLSARVPASRIRRWQR